MVDSLYLIVSTDGADTSKLNDWHEQVNDSKADSTVNAPFSVNVQLSEDVEINNTPTLILIDSEGKIVGTHIGPLTSTVEINDFWDQ